MHHDDGSAAQESGATTRPTDDGPVSSRPDAHLDVRTIAPSHRHPIIFDLLARLVPGQALALVVDHDPKPLRYQLDALQPGAYTWDYLQPGPRIWRVAVRRNADAA
jgi:uncharacterized protein (DUF2249 family)